MKIGIIDPDVYFILINFLFLNGCRFLCVVSAFSALPKNKSAVLLNGINKRIIRN